MPALVRIFLCFFLAVLCRAETIEEAARGLARRISLRMEPGVALRVGLRNLSSLEPAEAAKARAAFERALHRSQTRAVPPADVTLTISQNALGYLLIADLRHNADHIVEIVRYRPSAVLHATRISLEHSLLWQQETRVLDVAFAGEHLLVLEPASIVVYQRRAATWERMDAQALPAVPPVRDPRGRLQLSDSAFEADLPGAVCRGTWSPTLDVHCEGGAGSFPIGGEQIKFTPGRNSLEAPARPSFYSLVRLETAAGPVSALAELDGRTHVYDSANTPLAVFDQWGSDLAVAGTGCAGQSEILRTSASGPASPDSIVAFELEGPKALDTSDPIELPGPVTALWPAAGGAIAIVHILNSGSYAVYSLTVKCNA